MGSFNAPVSALVGREREIDAITDLVTRHSARLVTLVGEGGIGKTRLALETTARLRDSFSDGALVLTLESLTSSLQVELALADVLNIPQSGSEATDDLIVRVLREKHLLIVLDNYEQILPDVRLIARLLAEAPNVHLLVTSRERLNLRGEWAYALDGMAIPPVDAADATISTYESANLFLSLAQQQRRLDLTADDLRATGRICRAVQGIPLALELAASWSRLLSLKDIAAEIERDIGLLATTQRDFPERHRSMRAVFDQSCGYLTPDERDAFSRLSVFRGGFRREAAQFVAGMTLEKLASLADKSLIRPSANGRYTMHELLRQYAGEMLSANDATYQAARDAHAHYFADFMDQRTWELLNANQKQTMSDIRDEIDNLREAWQVVLQCDDPVMITKLYSAHGNFLDCQGRYQELVMMLEGAVVSLERHPDSPQHLHVLADVLTFLGWSYFRVGRIRDARSSLLRSQALYERTGATPRNVLAAPNSGLGVLAMIDGDFASALVYAEQARDDARRAGERPNEMLAEYVISSALLALGRYDDAYRTAWQGAALARGMGNLWFLAYIMNHLGQALTARGDYASAQRHFEESYAIRSDFGDPEGSALALYWMGRVLHLQGSTDEATTVLERSHRLYRDIGDRGGLTAVLTALGDTAGLAGDHALAQQRYQEALQIGQEAQFVTHILSLFVSVGEWLIQRGNRADGARLLAFVNQHSGAEQDARERSRTALATLPEVSPDSVAGLDWERAISFTQHALAGLPPDDAASSKTEALSERELEILRLIADGMSNQAIAEQLVLAVGTVKAHAAHIFDKLGVENRVQAVQRASALRLLR